MKGGYFEYAYYDTCWYQNDLFNPANFTVEKSSRKWFSRALPKTLFENGRIYENLGEWQNGYMDYPCGAPAALQKWLNQTAVKTALGVAANATMFSGDNGIGFTYISD